jgi:hypothetical protein
MHIDSYQFGKIVIDGVGCNKDVVILGDTVRENWRRIRGHSLSIDDLDFVIAAKPSVLVVGCGAFGMMSVPRRTRRALLEYGIQFEVLDTLAAVERFNELSQTGADVAAALHLTC